MTQHATVVHREQHDNRVALTLLVPVDLIYFPDHFAQFSLLPGVVQIDWAAQYTRQSFAVTGDCQKLEQIKFQAVIRPGDTVTLSLDWDASKQRVTFSYDSARGRHASGRLVFSAEAR